MQKDVVKMLLVNDEYKTQFGPGAADPAEPFTQDEIKAINYISGAGPIEECFTTCGRINEAISTALNIGFMAGYKHATQGTQGAPAKDNIIKLKIFKQPLPETIHGASAKGEDPNHFIILINEDMTPEEQAETFIHEMLHIWHRDHDNPAESIQKRETIRHKETAEAMARIRAEQGATK